MSKSTSSLSSINGSGMEDGEVMRGGVKGKGLPGGGVKGKGLPGGGARGCVQLLGDDEEERLEKLFRRLDVNGDGKIDVHDLSNALDLMRVPQYPGQAQVSNHHPRPSFTTYPSIQPNPFPPTTSLTGRVKIRNEVNV